MKICPMGAELFRTDIRKGGWTDRRTDRQTDGRTERQTDKKTNVSKLIVAVPNFANSLKSRFAVCHRVLPCVVFSFEFLRLYNQSIERSMFSGLLYCLKMIFYF
jgi:hypothetical protein